MIHTVADSELNIIDLVRYLVSRRRFLAVSCGSAVLLAGVISLLLPRHYTATASLVIEPPAGLDPRSATALSPVYLESLKTYESLVSGDTLFLQAVEQLGIRRRFAGRSIESLKRSVLKVSKPVNTRVIEISATLDDPHSAQQLASWIATHAAALNRSVDDRSASDSESEAAANLRRAEERLNVQRKASSEFTSVAAGLESELSNFAELKFSIDRDRGEARADLASRASSDEEQIKTVRARILELDRQSNELSDKIASASERVTHLRQKQDSLDEELKAARIGFEAARTRLDDLQSSAGLRGERLEVLDPGIVPQRASSPNIPLNVVAALSISLIASLCYLVFCFGYERARESREQMRRHW